jgi:hypothetical protein
LDQGFELQAVFKISRKQHNSTDQGVVQLLDRFGREFETVDADQYRAESHFLLSLLHEQGQGFDMPGVRKHVHHPCTLEFKTMLPAQNSGIACKAGGVAGNVQEPGRPARRDMRKHFLGAGTWGIDQDLIVGLAQPGRLTRLEREVRAMEVGVFDPVSNGIVSRSLDQAFVALHSNDFTGMPGQRKGEVSEPAKQVENAVIGCRLEQFYGAIDHQSIHFAVDLDEIRRLEADGYIMGRQAVLELDVGRLQRSN